MSTNGLGVVVLIGVMDVFTVESVLHCINSLEILEVNNQCCIFMGNAAIQDGTIQL